MKNAGNWHLVILTRTDVSEESIASIIRVDKVSDLGTLALISNCSLILPTQMMEAVYFSETSVLTRSTWHHIPEDGILYSHRRENLRSYTSSCFRETNAAERCIYSIFFTVTPGRPPRSLSLSPDYEVHRVHLPNKNFVSHRTLWVTVPLWLCKATKYVMLDGGRGIIFVKTRKTSWGSEEWRLLGCYAVRLL
jgi:hypothetical protein